MTTKQSIPLNLVINYAADVPHTAKGEGIAARAASIAARDLRQNFNVLPTGDPKRFAVVAEAAGSRR